MTSQNGNQQNSQQSHNTNQNQQGAPNSFPLFLPFTFIINGSSQNNHGSGNNANSTSPLPTSVPIQIQIPPTTQPQPSQPETPQNINIHVQVPATNPTNNDQTPDATANPINSGQASGIPPLPDGTSPFIHFFFYPIGEGATPAGMMFFTPFFMAPSDIQKPHASEQAMKKLPIVEITEKHINAQASCPICLDLFQIPDEKENVDSKSGPVREMPCKHQFCESCLFEWLRQSNTCPLCRKEIESEIPEAQEQHSNQPTAEEANPVRPMQGPNSNAIPVRQQQQSRGARHSPYTHRNANRHQATCALDRVGCCGESNNSNTNELPSPILTLPQCHHRFHSSCLRTSLLVEGYSLDAPNLTFRCPTCRAPAQLRNEELKVGGWIADNNVRNEQEESERSADISLPITIRLPNDTEQDCPEMDLD